MFHKRLLIGLMGLGVFVAQGVFAECLIIKNLKADVVVLREGDCTAEEVATLAFEKKLDVVGNMFNPEYSLEKEALKSAKQVFQLNNSHQRRRV